MRLSDAVSSRPGTPSRLTPRALAGAGARRQRTGAGFPSVQLLDVCGCDSSPSERFLAARAGRVSREIADHAGKMMDAIGQPLKGRCTTSPRLSRSASSSVVMRVRNVAEPLDTGRV